MAGQPREHYVCVDQVTTNVVELEQNIENSPSQ